MYCQTETRVAGMIRENHPRNLRNNLIMVIKTLHDPIKSYNDCIASATTSTVLRKHLHRALLHVFLSRNL